MSKSIPLGTVCFLEITNIFQKFCDFWLPDFFLEIFKYIGWCEIFLWIFGCLECVSIMYCLKFRSSEEFCIIGWCLVRQRNPKPTPYGFKNL
jgi:hypothetical protein